MLRGCPRDARLHDGVARPCVAPCVEIIPRRPRRRRARRAPPPGALARAPRLHGRRLRGDRDLVARGRGRGGDRRDQSHGLGGEPRRARRDRHRLAFPRPHDRPAHPRTRSSASPSSSPETASPRAVHRCRGTDEQDEAVARAAGAALGQALAQTLAPGVPSPSPPAPRAAPSPPRRWTRRTRRASWTSRAAVRPGRCASSWRPTAPAARAAARASARTRRL